jgi:hypothetical protein
LNNSHLFKFKESFCGGWNNFLESMALEFLLILAAKKEIKNI